MNLTKHAKCRKQQRGFSDSNIKVIMEYGRLSDAKGEAYKLFLGDKESQAAISELKSLIKVIEKAKGGTLVISGENIITVYKAKSA